MDLVGLDVWTSSTVLENSNVKLPSYNKWLTSEIHQSALYERN